MTDGGAIKTRRNGARIFKNPPQPHMCIQDYMQGSELPCYVNVLSWDKVAMSCNLGRNVPLYGGMRVSPPRGEKAEVGVFAVIANPELLKLYGKNAQDPKERSTLIEALLDFVEAENEGVYFSRQYTILKDKDITGELKEVWMAVQAKRDRGNLQPQQETWIDAQPPAPQYPQYSDQQQTQQHLSSAPLQQQQHVDYVQPPQYRSNAAYPVGSVPNNEIINHEREIRFNYPQQTPVVTQSDQIYQTYNPQEHCYNYRERGRSNVQQNPPQQNCPVYPAPQYQYQQIPRLAVSQYINSKMHINSSPTYNLNKQTYELNYSFSPKFCDLAGSQQQGSEKNQPNNTMFVMDHLLKQQQQQTQHQQQIQQQDQQQQIQQHQVQQQQHIQQQQQHIQQQQQQQYQDQRHTRRIRTRSLRQQAEERQFSQILQQQNHYQIQQQQQIQHQVQQQQQIQHQVQQQQQIQQHQVQQQQQHQIQIQQQHHIQVHQQHLQELQQQCLNYQQSNQQFQHQTQQQQQNEHQSPPENQVDVVDTPSKSNINSKKRIVRPNFGYRQKSNTNKKQDSPQSTLPSCVWHEKTHNGAKKSNNKQSYENMKWSNQQSQANKQSDVQQQDQQQQLPLNNDTDSQFQAYQNDITNNGTDVSKRSKTLFLPRKVLTRSEIWSAQENVIQTRDKSNNQAYTILKKPEVSTTSGETNIPTSSGLEDEIDKKLAQISIEDCKDTTEVNAVLS